jgi:hypothetical protein
MYRNIDTERGIRGMIPDCWNCTDQNYKIETYEPDDSTRTPDNYTVVVEPSMLQVHSPNQKKEQKSLLLHNQTPSI